jgi:hypothetical protein
MSVASVLRTLNGRRQSELFAGREREARERLSGQERLGGRRRSEVAGSEEDEEARRGEEGKERTGERARLSGPEACGA